MRQKQSQREREKRERAREREREREREKRGGGGRPSDKDGERVVWYNEHYEKEKGDREKEVILKRGRKED